MLLQPLLAAGQVLLWAGMLLAVLVFPDGDLLSDPHMPSCSSALSWFSMCASPLLSSPLVLHVCFSLPPLLLSVLHLLGCNNNLPPLTPLLPSLVWVFSPIILLIFCP